MKNFFTLLLLFSSFFGFAQISINSTTFSTSQNFNTLASSGTSSTLPANWSFAESGNNANATYTANNGSSSTGDTFSFGTTSSSDRCLGDITSGNLSTKFGVYFVNNSGSTITTISIMYTGEQWRVGSNNTDYLNFQYSLDATTISTGVWTNEPTLDFTSPILSATPSQLDGNLTANRTDINSTISVNIPNNSTLFLRWISYDATGADAGLGVDDFTFSVAATLPVSLTKFNAFFQNRQVNLNWSMANASNFDRFEVEHSNNGIDFTTLQSISTSNTMDYATTDANPSKGINYYRLKMMDLDGRFSYSEVKTVKVASETVWSVSPTKSSSLLTATVNENEESTIQLFNTNGQLVYNTIQNGNPKVEIPIGNLTSGIYIVRISVSGSVVYSERIIKE